MAALSSSQGLSGPWSSSEQRLKVCAMQAHPCQLEAVHMAVARVHLSDQRQ